MIYSMIYTWSKGSLQDACYYGVSPKQKLGMDKREENGKFWSSENPGVAQGERIHKISWPVGHPCVVLCCRIVCVKNMLIYICGFTRGDCQIILDKALKCFCFDGTHDLLKGTTKQITNYRFLLPCAKICLKYMILADFPTTVSEINISVADFRGQGRTLLWSKRKRRKISIF